MHYPTTVGRFLCACAPTDYALAQRDLGAIPKACTHPMSVEFFGRSVAMQVSRKRNSFENITLRGC